MRRGRYELEGLEISLDGAPKIVCGQGRSGGWSRGGCDKRSSDRQVGYVGRGDVCRKHRAHGYMSSIVVDDEGRRGCRILQIGVKALRGRAQPMIPGPET